MTERKVLNIVLWRSLGFVIFFAVIIFLNYLAGLVGNAYILSTVNFLNHNFWFLFISGIFFFIAELLFLFRFPMNLPAPIFTAIGSILILIFLSNTMSYIIDSTFYNSVNLMLFWIFSILYLVVPAIILTAGYLKILSKSKKKIKI